MLVDKDFKAKVQQFSPPQKWKGSTYDTKKKKKKYTSDKDCHKNKPTKIHKCTWQNYVTA